jgi:DNA-binding IclR family transcriptional regulator
VRGHDLKPRAVAVLVALRNEPRNRAQIRHAIGDHSTSSTADLLGDLRGLGMIGQVAGDDRWYLEFAGVGWLESNGLQVGQDSRRKVTS